MDQSIIERVFATVFPLVAIATIGYGYGRWRKPDLKLINQINMEVFVPLLVFVVLADQSVPISHLGPMAVGAIIVATIAGFLVALSGFQLPNSVQLPIDMLGQICIPLMLFTLGIRLTNIEFDDWKVGLVGAILCPVSGILMAIMAQFFLNLPPEQFAVLVVFGALPPAVLNYMVAEQYQQDPKRVASIVLIGNLMALVSIPITLSFVL